MKEKIGDAMSIIVENVVYEKIQLIYETGICFYSEQERHLIRVTGNKVYHSYSILEKIGQHKYRYAN